MRVAAGKVDGVESVDVTLKRGVANIALKPGNTVSLAQVRKAIKGAGYTSQDAVIVARGIARLTGRALTVEVTGTKVFLTVVEDAPYAAAFAQLRRAVRPGQSVKVEVAGTAPAPATDQAVSDTLRLRTVTINP